MPDQFGWDNNFGNSRPPTPYRKQLWECPKCRAHFYRYVIDSAHPVCGIKAKDCPAKIAAQTKNAAQAAPEAT